MECLALTLLLTIAAVILSACSTGRAGQAAPAVLRIAGSTSLRPVLEDLAAAYQAAHPTVLVEVRGGGAAMGVQQLHQGQINLAAVSWRAEGEQLPDDIRAIPIARDGIAVIVHPTNPITNLTSLQVRAIYRGELLDWAALGHTGAMPTVISREEGSGTRAAFEALVMGGERVTLNALVLPTGDAIIDYVASHRDAIGYVSSANLTDRVHVIALEEVALDAAALRAGAYCLGRVLYLYAPAAPSPAAQDFVDFALSPAGQAIVAERMVAVR